MNYDVVCESCEASVIEAPHIGDPEADALAKHLIDHHGEHLSNGSRPGFAQLVKRFRLRKPD